MKHNQLYFKPLIKNATLQTILGGALGRAKVPKYFREYVNISENDKLLLDISTPKNWNQFDYSVVMIHGLCGCSESEYLLRMTNLFLEINLRVIRVSLHGQGDSLKLHSKSIYHGGSSVDIEKVFRYIANKTPNSPMIGIGFSLSGNIILKMLSKIKSTMPLLDYVISVCPSLDLKDSSKRINKGANKIFEKYFIKLCIKMAERRFHEFDEIKNIPDLNKKMSLYQFDDIYTSREAGYKNADDYYKAASSINTLDSITIKTDILVALDDPLIDNRKVLKLDVPKNIRINYTEYGGHMGYLEWPFGKRWLDNQLLSWVKSHIISNKLKNINKFK